MHIKQQAHKAGKMQKVNIELQNDKNAGTSRRAKWNFQIC